MTPTEKKAREIYERFDKNKKYALICVNREIEIYKSYMHYEMVKDLQEVKNHIEKL